MQQHHDIGSQNKKANITIYSFSAIVQMSLIYIIFLFSSQPLKVCSLNGKKYLFFVRSYINIGCQLIKICCHCIDNRGKCYFNWILLLFWANESIISDTVKSISLWINNKASPFNLSFVIVLLSHVLILLISYIHKLQ